MTKLEIVKKEYGEYYEKCSPNENGWIDYDTWFKYIGHKIDYDYLNNQMLMRSKSLKGIENNNGWIKIETENDLPQKFGEYKFIHKDRIVQMGFNPKIEDLKNCVTAYSHWKSIEKDVFPLY